METKKVLICDKKWYSKNKTSMKEIDYDDILCIDFKNNFSYIILNEISNRKNDIICIIGKSYEDELRRADEIIKFAYNNHNSCVVACEDMDDFDFSKFGAHDTVVCFPSKIFSDRPDKKVFSTVMELQKYFIFVAFNSRKFYLYLLNNNNNFKKIETDEDKRIRSTRKYPPQNKKISREKKEIESSQPVQRTSGNPKILFVCDVKGWAWWIKSQYIKKYLSDEFDIDIINVIGEGSKSINYKKYDIYFTYGYSYVSKITGADYNRRVAGVTAHRPIDALKSKLNKVKWTHANSLLLYNEISSVFSNTFYIPNGVDTDLFYPQKESSILERDYINIGHVGKLSPRKRQKEIIEPVIEKLKKRGNKVNYISHYNNYKNKISHNEMPNLYQDMDILLVASKEDGTPASLLDGASCQVPTIGNRIGNLPEFITQGVNGYIVENPTIDNYVKTIESLSKEHIVEMGKNARQTAENEWTWEIQAENYRYMFKNILGIK